MAGPGGHRERHVDTVDLQCWKSEKLVEQTCDQSSGTATPRQGSALPSGGGAISTLALGGCASSPLTRIPDEEGDLEAAGHVELSENAADMRLDSGNGEEKLDGDIGVRLPLADRDGHFKLARSQCAASFFWAIWRRSVESWTKSTSCRVTEGERIIWPLTTLRMASTSSVGSLSFITYPAAPARNDSVTSSLRSNVVSMMTSGDCRAFLISWVARIPFIRGMRMSMRTTSTFAVPGFHDLRSVVVDGEERHPVGRRQHSGEGGSHVRIVIHDRDHYR